MKLIFADDTTLEIKNIFGGPEFIQAANRDVLTIEVDPKVADLNKLKEIFSDKEKIKFLKTSEMKKINELVDVEDGKQEMKEVEKEIITELGNYYTLYLGCQNEVREVRSIQASPNQFPMEEVNKVRIGQMTYAEMQMEKMMAFMKQQGMQI